MWARSGSALVLLLALLSATRAAAQESTGGECCLVLLLPVGARAVALGGSLTARPSADAMFANPAGLSGLSGTRFVLHHTTGFPGARTAFTLLTTRRVLGTFGVSYQLLDYGDEQATDPDGNPIGTITTRDHMLLGSFATEMGAGLQAGFSYKYYRFRLGCSGNCEGVELTASTHALDAGVQYHPRWLGSLQLGAALVNVGFPLQFVNAEQSDPLPSRLRLGAAYEVLQQPRPDSTVALWVGLELNQKLSEWEAPVPALAVELTAANRVSLRAGYRAGEGVESGAAVGVGLRYRQFTIGVAKSFTSSVLAPEEEPFHVTFGVDF